MKINILPLSIVALLGIGITSCDTQRSNTKREMDETQVVDGDTIDPTEGVGEGNSGHKFMETTGDDTLDNVEQDNTVY